MRKFGIRCYLATVLITFFETGASASVIEILLRLSVHDQPSYTEYYTFTQEMRDDLGATDGYDAGLDLALDTSAKINDKFPVIYKDLGGQKVEHDYVPHPHIGDSYSILASVENRTFTDLFARNNKLIFIQYDISDNPNGVVDFLFDFKVDVDANDNFNDFYDFFQSGRLSELYLGPGRQTEGWDQNSKWWDDHRNGFLNGMLTLTAIGVDADFDDNNIVDGKDFLDLQRNFGTSSALHAEGDSNADYQVNSADIATWESQFGQAVSTPATTVIPEPTSVVLVGLAGLICCSRRRR